MTFSDIVTVLGAGTGILLLLTVAAAPLLADLEPNPRRRRTDGAGDRSARRRAEPAVTRPRCVTDMPTPRSPAARDTPARVPGARVPSASVRHAIAG